MAKIRKLDKIRTRAIRIALTAFVADPSLGKRQAKPLFLEILAHLQSGMNDEVVVQTIVKNNTAIGNSQLSL